MKKQCTRCGETKPLSDFHLNPKMADGRLRQCKNCTRAAKRRHRRQNLVEVRESDRARKDTDAHREAVKRNYRRVAASSEGKARLRSIGKRWAANHPERPAAKIAVNNALRDGKLTKQPCERCGTTAHVQGHHEDYSRPLDVMWLCRTHHAARHREINEARRSAQT